MKPVNGGFLPELGVVQVAAPCRSDWEQMNGDAQVRHCAQCKLNVYNLSELTAEEARTLLISTEGKLCVRFWVRPDGKLLTRDCPVGLAARARKKVAAIVASLAALAMAAWGIFGATTEEEPCAAAAPLATVAPAPAGEKKVDEPLGGADYAERRRKQLGGGRGRFMQGRVSTIQVITSSPEK